MLVGEEQRWQLLAVFVQLVRILERGASIAIDPTSLHTTLSYRKAQGQLDRAAQRLHMQTIRDRTRLTSYQTLSHVALFMSTQLGGTHVTVSLGWCLSNDFLLLVKHRPAPLSARGG